MVWDMSPAIQSVTLLRLNCCFLYYACLQHLRASLSVQEGFITLHKEYTQNFIFFFISIQPQGMGLKEKGKFGGER